MHPSAQKKIEKIVRMDQKWTKRQNERPPESTEIDFRPFRKQATIYSPDKYREVVHHQPLGTFLLKISPNPLSTKKADRINLI